MNARLLMIALMLAVPLTAAAQEKPVKSPKVEVAFVIDTTGSMKGLIEAAKKKVWSIATEIMRGKPTPELRLGLVAYRDKGDAYVTAVTDLTDNLDKIYGVLMDYKADGGGDDEENVRQALHDAINKMGWSKDKETLRIIFLVGDYPPHTDYADVPTIDEICQQAARAETIINAVCCGNNAATVEAWKHIAAKAEGKYVSIAQDGGVVAVETPFDKELGELSDKLGRTVVAFGSLKAREALERTRDAAEEYPGEAKAPRAAAKATADRYSSDDLVDAVRDGRVKLEEVKDEELPEEMRKMSPDERKAFVEKKGKEREEVRAKILELSKKRDEFIAEELRKRGTKDAFDQVVLEAVREQAQKKGIKFEEK